MKIIDNNDNTYKDEYSNSGNLAKMINLLDNSII